MTPAEVHLSHDGRADKIETHSYWIGQDAPPQDNNEQIWTS